MYKTCCTINNLYKDSTVEANITNRRSLVEVTKTMCSDHV